MIEIGADLRGITDYNGAMKALVQDFSSREFLDRVTGLAGEVAVQSFNEAMDKLAPTAPERFGHMYDWGQVGQEGGRLWAVIIGGTDAMKLATFDYKQSKKEVPAGSKNTGIAGDTRIQRHVFKWKAPVIENGIRVRIDPINGEWLAIPTTENNSNSSKNSNKGGTMWFTKSTVSPPVNRIAQGAFTEAWVEHFATVGQTVAQEYVFDKVEEYLNQYLTIVIGYNRKAQVTRGAILVASNRGETIGHRTTGGFMKNFELAEQILRLQRIADGYA